MAGEERLRLRHPPQEAEGPTDERGDVARQWPSLESPRLRRARLRAAEIQDGPVHPHHRHRPRQDQDRHGQPCLQYDAFCLARGANRVRMTARAAKAAAAAPKSISPPTIQPAKPMLCDRRYVTRARSCPAGIQNRGKSRCPVGYDLCPRFRVGPCCPCLKVGACAESWESKQ